MWCLRLEGINPTMIATMTVGGPSIVSTSARDEVIDSKKGQTKHKRCDAIRLGGLACQTFRLLMTRFVDLGELLSNHRQSTCAQGSAIPNDTLLSPILQAIPNQPPIFTLEVLTLSLDPRCRSIVVDTSQTRPTESSDVHQALDFLLLVLPIV